MKEKRKLRILVVDDNDDLRNAIIFVLGLLDHDTVGAESAERGEELIKEDNFDIIFSDIKMKGKDGIEFSKEVNSKRPGTPVVLMTAYNDFSEFLERAREQRVFDVVPKPLTKKKILEVITRVRKNERKSSYS